MIDKILYQNKQAFQNDEDIPTHQKVTDLDMNEIKKVVNNNAEELNSTNEKVALGFKSAFTYKGSVNTYTDLEDIVAINGDIYTVNDEGKNYAYNGTNWIEYNVNINISEIESEIEELSNKVNSIKKIIVETTSRVVETEIQQNTNYEVPTYAVGTNSLFVYLEGCKLIKDENYIEVDTTHIQFKDWNVPVGSSLEIIIRKEEE
mgnify:FL=1